MVCVWVCAYPESTLMTIVKECHLQTKAAGRLCLCVHLTNATTQPVPPAQLHFTYDIHMPHMWFQLTQTGCVCVHILRCTCESLCGIDVCVSWVGVNCMVRSLLSGLYFLLHSKTLTLHPHHVSIYWFNMVEVITLELPSAGFESHTRMFLILSAPTCSYTLLLKFFIIYLYKFVSKLEIDIQKKLNLSTFKKLFGFKCKLEWVCGEWQPRERGGGTGGEEKKRGRRQRRRATEQMKCSPLLESWKTGAVHGLTLETES